MIFCHDYRLAYVHVPKTGGSTMAVELSEASRGRREKAYTQPGWQSKYHGGRMHSTVADCVRDGSLNCEMLASWTIAATVRNPYTRAYSRFLAWAFRVAKKPTIQNFIWFLCNQSNHRALGHPQQTRYLTLDGHLVANRLVRFESFERDTAELLQSVGIERSNREIVHANKGHDRPPYVEFYNEEAQQLVAEICADDFAAFGYDPENIVRSEAIIGCDG